MPEIIKNRTTVYGKVFNNVVGANIKELREKQVDFDRVKESGLSR